MKKSKAYQTSKFHGNITQSLSAFPTDFIFRKLDFYNAIFFTVFKLPKIRQVA